MRRLFLGILSVVMFASCDDGEIVVTNFDFEDSNLQFCAGPNKNVIYAINNNDVFESISLEYNNNQLTTDEDGDLVPPDEEQISFSLSGNNRMVYRLYDSEVPSNYFCNVVPPSQPQVVEEWVSGTGATVFVNTGFTDETGNADPDGDGLVNIEEGWDPDGADHQDTDNDEIPDYLDVDDDGDNVETLTELITNNEDPVNEDGLKDTDEDGIPNYLDEDDDGDAVITRFEVDENDPDNPGGFSSTGDGRPNYLNPEQTASFEHQEYIPHDIDRSYGFQIFVENLKFERQDGSGETIQFQTYNLGNLRANRVEYPLCPAQDPDCEEGNGEEPAPQN